MPGRSFTTETGYRYGFNGQEKDDEIKGSGNQIDYGMRTYDPRLARFMSVDLLTRKFPGLTPFQFASDNPIQNVDLDGLEAWEAIRSWRKEDKQGFAQFASTQLKKYTDEKITDDCADLAIRLISEYAYINKLPLSLTTSSGDVISNETEVFSGVTINTGDKDAFIKAAQDHIDANTLAKKNTYAVDNKDSQEGDMRIILDGSFHHTMIISDKQNERVVYGGSSAGQVVEGNDFTKSPNSSPTYAGNGNASRFNALKESDDLSKTRQSPPPPIDEALEGAIHK